MATRSTSATFACPSAHAGSHTRDLTFLVTDRAVADERLRGDRAPVRGTLGRPDLLERAAKGMGRCAPAPARCSPASSALRAAGLASDLARTWGRLGVREGISAVPHSSLGYERRLIGHSPPLTKTSSCEQVSKDSPSHRSTSRNERREQARSARARCVDGRRGWKRPRSWQSSRQAPRWVTPGREPLRPVTSRDAQHSLNKSFSTWAGSILPYDQELYLLVDDNVAERADEVARDLAMIGLDRIAGYFGVDALSAWAQDGRELGAVPQVTADELGPLLLEGDVHVIDVRGAHEWDAGHLPGAPNMPLSTLAARVAEVPRDRPVVVQCQAGGRSAIAASLLRARGVERVANLRGGFGAWRDAGLPVEKTERQRTESNTEFMIQTSKF